MSEHKHSSRVAFTGAVLAGALAFTGGPEASIEQPQAEVVSPYIEKANADPRCGSIAVRSTILRPDEITALPALSAGTYDEVWGTQMNDVLVTYTYRNGQLEASRYIGDGKSVVGDGALPKLQAEAFREALEDPYVHCVMAEHIDALNVRASDRDDDGSYADVNDQIDVRLTESVRPEDRIFTTKASIRSLLTHEGTHGIVQEWREKAQKGDRQTVELLNELNGLYAEEYKIVAEDFRRSHGGEIDQHLGVLAELFREKGYENTTAAIELVRAAFRSPGGIAELALRTDKDTPGVVEYERRSLYEMIYAAADLHGHKIEDGAFGQKAYAGIGEETAPPVSLDMLDGAERIYMNFLETAYPANDESSVLEGVDGEGAGWPYQNADEMTASTVTVRQLAPDRSKKARQNLPSDRGELEKHQQDVILQLYALNNPHLLRYMQLLQNVEK